MARGATAAEDERKDFDRMKGPVARCGGTVRILRWMRRFLVCMLLCLGGPSLCAARAQSAAVSVDKHAMGAELQRSLSGMWVGTLEYRDYSEPATSTKRVKLPTWLSVAAAEGVLRFHYVYDDGPTKVVTDEELIRIDAAAGTYDSRGADGKLEDSYSIAGLEQLHDGRGVLVLTGKGTENNAPAEVRTTMRIGRNILEMTRETAAAGQPLTFRHAYTFVRAAAPQVPATK